MLKLEQHIGELLYTHDCVIVPNLGGFLASNQSSSVSAISHSIYPPFRKIAFNIYLRQNDGLLANQLVTIENVTYEEAIRQIDRFVTDCLDRLDQGRRVFLHNIGTLYYDAERNIQFEASRSVNYLIDSFGLQPVHFSPVQKTTESPKAIPADRPSVPSTSMRSKAKRARNILGVVGITAAIAWFSFNLYLVSPKKYQSTSLATYDSQSFIPKKDTTVVQTVVPQPSVPETVYVASVPPEQSEPLKTENTETKTAEVITPATGFSFHVISGVFRIRENAEAQLQSLRQRGFGDAVIIEANGRNYVAYGSFSTNQQAITMADSLRSDSAWIWKN